MLAGILVLLALAAGTLSLASLVNGRLTGGQGQSDSTQARAAAEEGLNQIIATFNQPENRKLLVSGTAMNSWAGASGTTLQSPCVRGDGTRPGSNNGQPTSQARAYGDGAFRDVETGTVDSGERRFALQSVTYATGANGAANRRSLAITTTAGSSTLTTTGTYPSGVTHDRLVNLEDPDGSGALLPGSNSGFLTLQVQGQVVRGGRVIATATVAREFQVVPKCCGASFGSNGSGGVTVGSGSLGADSRYCGVQFGVIVGINGGTVWTFYANDRYTTRNASGQVVSINSLLGVLKSGQTTFQRNNCRVLPTASNGQCSPSQSAQDQSYGTTIGAASPGGVYGSATDIAGTSISGIPLVPIALGSLPSINTNYAYGWTSSGRPQARINTAANAGYPLFTSSGTTYRLYLRSRSDTNDLEVCEATYASCTNTAWATVLQSTSLTIADDFASGGYSGSSGTVNRWPAAWTETDPTTGGSATAGSVAINSGALRLTGGSAATRAITRPVNLYGLQTPSLRFTYSRSSLTGTKPLIVEYSTNNGGTWTQLVSLAATTSSGSTQTLTLPAAAQAPYTLLRFRLGATFLATEWVALDNVVVGNASGAAVATDPWCEYTTSSPRSGLRGFHCLGPQLNLSAGGSVIIDTSGGPISFYYNQASDTRGSSQTVSPFTVSSPLIATDNGATVQHVFCASLSNACDTPISESVYAPVGEPDRLNFFGRDSGNTQFLNVGSLANSSASPGKIAGVWFYFPVGNLTLTVDGCADGSTPANFYTNDDGWNISGRIWVRDLKPCGAFHFRVPPSDLADTTTLFGSTTLGGSNVAYVNWAGVDWVARSVSNSRVY